MEKILSKTSKKNEIEYFAEKITDSYIDYPMFTTLFSGAKDYRQLIFYLTYVRLFLCYDRLLTNDDKSVCVCIIRPGDKTKIRRMFELLFSKGLFRILFNLLSPQRILLLIQFAIMTEKMNKGIYNPKRDYFIKTLWIDPSLRGGKMLRAMLRDMRDIVGSGNKVFFETDSSRLVTLYKRIGANVCAETKWKGVNHTLMCFDVQE